MKKVFNHPSGRSITFNAQWHQYTMEGVGTLKSVSKVLDKHFPFDEVRVSSLVSKKTGQSREDVVSGWKRQAVLGKNVHAYIEAKLQNQPPPEVPMSELHGDEPKYYPVASDAVARVTGLYDTLAIEAVIASPQLGLAGTIDFLGKNKRTGAILVGDWKTSGSVASNFRFGSFETPSLGPLSHLLNTKFYRYALQVMIYGYILRLEGYERFYGKEILSQPMEYGIIQMSKNESGDVFCEFKAVTEATITPRDLDLTHLDIVRKLVAQP
jgi:hypothetical protein